MAFSFTPLDLERLLVQNVAIWCADMLFKSPQDGGKVPRGISVYQGHIPTYQAGQRGPATAPKAPSIAIKTHTFEYVRERGTSTVGFMILTWDDDNTRRGYIDVLNVMNRIIYGLEENVMISQAFPLLDHPIKGELIDDPAMDYHPYYLGSIQAEFGIMTPGPGTVPPYFGNTDAGEYNVTDPARTLEIIAPNDIGWDDPT